MEEIIAYIIVVVAEFLFDIFLSILHIFIEAFADFDVGGRLWWLFWSILFGIVLGWLSVAVIGGFFINNVFFHLSNIAIAPILSGFFSYNYAVKRDVLNPIKYALSTFVFVFSALITRYVLIV